MGAPVTESEINQIADDFLGECLNATARGCIEVWRSLMLQGSNYKDHRMAKFADAANKYLRDARKANETQYQQIMADLADLQHKKAEASTKARRLTVVNGGG